MSLTNNEMVMPVSPLYANGNGGGGGNNGFNGDGAWWLLVLFLFAFRGGWGNDGNSGGGNSMPYVVNNDVQRGFDQSAIMNGLTGISTAVANGFANAEISRANTNTNTLQAIWGVQSALQNCCCENRAGLADLKYTVATENCADRQALNEGVQSIIASQNAGIQTILDKLCDQELQAARRENDQLRQQLTAASLEASQVRQTADIQNNIINELRSCPIPAQPVYGSQPIFTCGNNNGCGCGCGGNF